MYKFTRSTVSCLFIITVFRCFDFQQETFFFLSSGLFCFSQYPLLAGVSVMQQESCDFFLFFFLNEINLYARNLV